MTVQIITRWSELAACSAAWSRLLECSATPGPTLSPLWMGAWWRVFGHHEGRALRAVLVRDGDRLIGLAPLLARRLWYRGVVPIRRIELLASGEREEDEICSDYLNVVAERGRENQVARQVVDALVNGSLGPWDELVLDPVHGCAAMTEHLTSALGRAGMGVDIGARRLCPYAVLPGSWEGYLQKLPSRHRYVLRRGIRNLDKWATGAGGVIDVMRAQNRDQLAQGQKILMDLHAQRWRQAGHEGAFVSWRFSEFHRQVMAELLDRNCLDLMWLMYNGEPIAALYNIVWNHRVYSYQSGRRVDLPGSLRPGIVLHVHAMQHAIVRGCKEYDFLAGKSQYKAQLATDDTSLVRVRAVRPGSLAMAVRGVVARGENLARDLRRRWRQRGA